MWPTSETQKNDKTLKSLKQRAQCDFSIKLCVFVILRNDTLHFMKFISSYLIFINVIFLRINNLHVNI